MAARIEIGQSRLRFGEPRLADLQGALAIGEPRLRRARSARRWRRIGRRAPPLLRRGVSETPAASSISAVSRARSCANWPMRRSSSAVRSLARRSSPSSASRARTSRCKAAPARASSSRKGASAAAATACARAASAWTRVRSATSRTSASSRRSRLVELRFAFAPGDMQSRAPRCGGCRRRGPCSAAPGAPGASGRRSAPRSACSTSSSRSEIVLGALQAQLGFVAARMQAGDARRLFQDQPARLRLGGDDLADLALAHQSRRARAGRGVGEQQLHVLARAPRAR